MLLTATDLGLASLVWAGPAAAIGQSEELWGLLGIPESMNPLLCASFGYAQAEEPAKEHRIAVTRI